MYLLIDECCGKRLVTIVESLGHTAQRTQHIPLLGSGADDRTIFEYARMSGANLVTDMFVEIGANGRISAFQMT